MATKGATIHFRLSEAEQASIEAFMSGQAFGAPDSKARPEPNLSDAIRRLIALGLRAVQPSPEIHLKAVLQEIDPAWSGRVPRFEKPLKLTVAGSAALEGILETERRK